MFTQQAIEMSFGPFRQLRQDGLRNSAGPQPIKGGLGLRNLRRRLGRQLGQLLFQ
jgi:hypothetical protein